VQRWHNVERLRRKEPDRPVGSSRHALDDDGDVSRRPVDRANELQLRFERVVPRAFGRVAQLRQTRWEPGVEDDEQLPGQIGRRLPAEPRIQVLACELVVAAACRVQESENRPARRASAEGILWLRSRRRGWR
jgi:hypothetical protein